jgi:hypothetical protein
MAVITEVQDYGDPTQEYFAFFAGSPDQPVRAKRIRFRDGYRADEEPWKSWARVVAQDELQPVADERYLVNHDHRLLAAVDLEKLVGKEYLLRIHLSGRHANALQLIRGKTRCKSLRTYLTSFGDVPVPETETLSP